MDIYLLNYITIEPELEEEVFKVRPFEIPLGKKAPNNRFISAYGTKTTSIVLSTARRQAIKEKKNLYRIDLLIDGGNIPSGKSALPCLFKKGAIFGKKQAEIADRDTHWWIG